jgi:hypothetical protein
MARQLRSAVTAGKASDPASARQARSPRERPADRVAGRRKPARIASPRSWGRISTCNPSRTASTVCSGMPRSLSFATTSPDSPPIRWRRADRLRPGRRRARPGSRRAPPSCRGRQCSPSRSPASAPCGRNPDRILASCLGAPLRDQLLRGEVSFWCVGTRQCTNMLQSLRHGPEPHLVIFHRDDDVPGSPEPKRLTHLRRQVDPTRSRHLDRNRLHASCPI